MSSVFFMMKFLQKRLRTKKLDINKPYPQVFREELEEFSDKMSRCRACMKEASIPLYKQDCSFDIAEALSTFGGLELSLDDGYPNQICLKCYSFLENAVLFRRTAQDSDKIFRLTRVQQADHFNTQQDTRINNHDNKECLKFFNCKLCKLPFKSREELVVHKKTRSHKNIRIQCPVCHGLLTAQLYKKHLARHQSVTHLICHICGKIYRRDNLARHLQFHSYELPHQCQICPYRGRFMESLNIHMRTHTGDKPFSCDKCKLRFLTRSNLNRHVLTHNKEKSYRCNECGKSFHTKRDMDHHFTGDHTHSLKCFSCRMCGNKYGSRKALMRHELRVHKRDKLTKGRVPLYKQAEYQAIT